MQRFSSASRSSVSRRGFLRDLSLVLAGGIPLLSACAAQPAAAPTSTPAPAATAAKPAATVAAAQPTAAQTAAPATTAPAKAAGPVTLKFLTWFWAEPGRNEAYRAVVKKFHEVQSDIKIEEVGFPYAEFFQRVMTQLAGGGLDADVLTFYDEIAVRLMKGNYLEPMDDVATKLGITSKLNPIHDVVKSGGKLYGLMANQVPFAIMYNTEIYGKAGITKPPSTQEEYFAVAKQLTKRPDQFGHAARTTMAEQNGWFWDLTHWVLGYGGVWAKAKKPLVTEAPVVNAIKAYKKLYDEAVPQGSTASDYRRMAAEGKVGQYIDNSACIGIMRSLNESIYPKFLSAPPPWENRRAMSVSNFLGTYAGSKNKDAAKTWLQFFFTTANNQIYSEKAMEVVPPYEGAMREEYLKGFPWLSGFSASKGVPLVSVLEGFEANIAEFRQTVLGKCSEVLSAGKAPELAMQEAQKDLEALAARI